MIESKLVYLLVISGDKNVCFLFFLILQRNIKHNMVTRESVRMVMSTTSTMPAITPGGVSWLLGGIVVLGVCRDGLCGIITRLC